MEKYVVLEKAVGETPLSCAEAFRETRPDLSGIPLSYAGRLDPMASGKLLVLIGEECKKQSEYHDLDKEYEFSVLFGIASDTGDVLGRLSTETKEFSPHTITQAHLNKISQDFVGTIEFPYPVFSAKTVAGKPLHMWTLEGRLNEISIPTRISTIHALSLTNLASIERTELAASALKKIETIPPVTDMRKALGNDFRRVDVRNDWNLVATSSSLPDTYMIATFLCIATSGTYMRTLAQEIAKRVETIGLAWSIHRTKVGSYNAETNAWSTLF